MIHLNLILKIHFGTYGDNFSLKNIHYICIIGKPQIEILLI